MWRSRFVPKGPIRGLGKGVKWLFLTFSQKSKSRFVNRQRRRFTNRHQFYRFHVFVIFFHCHASWHIHIYIWYEVSITIRERPLPPTEGDVHKLSTPPPSPPTRNTLIITLFYIPKIRDTVRDTHKSFPGFLVEQVLGATHVCRSLRDRRAAHTWSSLCRSRGLAEERIDIHISLVPCFLSSDASKSTSFILSYPWEITGLSGQYIP